jgi:hypothetical protein
MPDHPALAFISGIACRFAGAASETSVDNRLRMQVIAKTLAFDDGKEDDVRTSR